MTTFQPSKVERLTPRTVATRAKLVTVAERLFAEHGVEGVSLNEINKLAGQRNSNACQYHFGSKNGLLQAILDKHLPGIAMRRNEMLDRVEAAEHRDVRDVVRAFVYPVAEKLFDANGGKEFVRVNAQLVVRHTLSMRHLTSSPLNVPGQQRLTRSLEAVLADRQLPELVLGQRLLLAAILLFHALADHSRLLEVLAPKEPGMDTQLFVGNLEDSIVAMLTAPLSDDMRGRLQALSAE
jgi:AcrR family transcriptional regulator